jgi:hypothetical protein
VSRFATLALLASGWLVVFFLPAPAQAAPCTGDCFSVAMSPTAVQPVSSSGYALVITNRGSSTDSADNAHVSVPTGFLVDALSLSATASCTNASWTVTLDAVTSTIDAVAPPGGELCPSGRLTIGFTASAPLLEGDYEWTTGLYFGSNAFQLQGPQPVVTVDGTSPPAPTITSHPPNVTSSTTASFSFDDAEGDVTFQCALDGGDFSPCSSPKAYSGLAEGDHSFAVEAVDPAGNASGADTDSWTIDLTPPPAPTITSHPPNVTYSTSATFSFDDAEAGATFRCKLDGSAFSPCSSPKDYSGLAEGGHTFAVKGVDGVGNASAATSYGWTIDLTNPVVTSDPASQPPALTNHTSASFAFTSNHPGSSFECRLDNGQFSPCTSPKSYSGLPDGLRRFGVRATDTGGHLGLETVYEWTIDTVPPATTITSGPPATTNSRSATFAFGSSESPATFACSLDGGAFAACSSPKAYNGLADGTHVFQVRATDRAGNVDSTPAPYSWQIVTSVPPDTTPPGTVLGLRRSVGWRTLRLSWQLPSDGDFDHVVVMRTRSAKGAARAVVYEGSATGYRDRRFTNGTYYRYEVVSYDHAGNASPAIAVVVRPSALLRSPRDGAVLHAPPIFRWARIRSATYYNVQLYRGSKKVLSAWPAKPTLRLKRGWVYEGNRFRLRKGVYHWWVWPAFGPRSRANYGRMLGTGSFRVR